MSRIQGGLWGENIGYSLGIKRIYGSNMAEQGENFGIFEGKKNPGANSWISLLERKFIVLAGSMPRSEDRFTNFSVPGNFPANSGVWTRPSSQQAGKRTEWGSREV
jgi:hypothetical protein